MMGLGDYIQGGATLEGLAHAPDGWKIGDAWTVEMVQAADKEFQRLCRLHHVGAHAPTTQETTSP